MTCYFALSTTAQGISGVCALLLTAGALFILISACSLRPGRWSALAASVLTAGSFLLLQGIGDVSRCRIFDDTPTFLGGIFGALPGAAVVFLLLLLIGVEAVLLVKLKHRRENMLTPTATKESLDALPDGICFFAPNGQPLLINTRMHRICGELFHMELQNGEVFWQRLKNGEGNARFLRTGATVFLRTGEGRVWDFRCRKLTVNRTEVRELIACDVTTSYRLNRELDERNRSLRRVNERLRRYSREVERSTMENEILTAKIQVHDNIGRSLLMLRAYLAQPRQERRRDELLLLWRHTVAVLKNEAVPEKPGSDWELLRKAAQSVDVEIVRDGELPENERQRAVVIPAVHECLTNTVKHAGGDRLYLTLRNKGNVLIAELTNSGAKPRGPIQETGGLLDLRRAVEKAGGKMTTEAAPRFLLRVELPGGGNGQWQR